MTTPIDVILRFVKTGQGAEQAQAALKGLGQSANRADVEMSAMGATAQASQRKLQQLGDEVARGKKSVEQATREWKEYQGAISSGKIPKETSNLKSFATGALAVGAALGTAAVAAKEAYEAIGEGADLELANKQFENLAESIGTTATALKSDLRAATNGMVSDAKLVASASQLIDLGLAKSHDQAVRLGAAVGALNLDMQVLGLTLANNSKARLDSLRLSMEDVVAIQKELEAQGFQGDAFDEAVIIALEEKMALLGDTSETMTGQLQIVAAGWENVTNASKEWLALKMAPTVSGLSQTVGALNSDVAQGRGGWDNFKIVLGEVGKVMSSNDVVWNNMIETAKEGDAQIQRQVSHLQRQAEEQAAVEAAIARARAEQEAQTQAIRDYHQAAAAAAGINQDLADKQAQLNNHTHEGAGITQATKDLINEANAANAAYFDQLEEGAKIEAAAAEAAAERAKIAAETGDLFTQFSDADGALKFYNESLDELGQQYVAVGGRTAEQSADLDRLQGAYDKAAQTIKDYELGIKGANLSDELRNEKIAEQQEIMANLAANMQPLLGIQSELVSVNNALSINQDAVNQAMYAAADAAGADAAQLAILKVATGELSPVQAEAVIKSVALEQTLKNLGQRYAEGDLTLQGYIQAAQQAVQDINSMTVEFNEQTGAITTSNAEAAALIDTLGRLPTHHDFVIKITQDGEIPTLPTGPGSARAAATLAEGGPVPAGPPISGYGADNVMIAAQTGEYMLKRSAVQKLGLNRLNYMNNTGRLPGFAEGGVIGSDTAAAPLSGASVMFQPIIQVTGVVSRQQGMESGRNILNGLVDAARGRGVRI